VGPREACHGLRHPWAASPGSAQRSRARERPLRRQVGRAVPEAGSDRTLSTGSPRWARSARSRARSGSSATRRRVLHGEGMGLHHEACGPPPCAPPHRPLCQSVPVVDRGPPPPHRGAPRSVMPFARSKPHATLCSPVPAHGPPPHGVSGREVLTWVSHCESVASHDERHRCLPGLRAGVREALPTPDTPALRLSYGALQGAGTALARVEIEVS